MLNFENSRERRYRQTSAEARAARLTEKSWLLGLPQHQCLHLSLSLCFAPPSQLCPPGRQCAGSFDATKKHINSNYSISFLAFTFTMAYTYCGVTQVLSVNRYGIYGWTCGVYKRSDNRLSREVAVGAKMSRAAETFNNYRPSLYDRNKTVYV